MPAHRIFATSFASIYPLYVEQGGAEGPQQGRGRSGHLLAHRVRQRRPRAEPSPSRSTWRPSSPKRRRINPECVPDHGRDLRRSRGGDRRSADAEDPLPGQAGRRAGQGQEDGDDPARWQRSRHPHQDLIHPDTAAVGSCRSRRWQLGWHDVGAAAQGHRRARRLPAAWVARSPSCRRCTRCHAPSGSPSPHNTQSRLDTCGRRRCGCSRIEERGDSLRRGLPARHPADGALAATHRLARLHRTTRSHGSTHAGDVGAAARGHRERGDSVRRGLPARHPRRRCARCHAPLGSSFNRG